jgi:hypothetical protein
LPRGGGARGRRRTTSAIVAYGRAIADFRGVADTAKLEAARAELDASPAGRRARKEEEKRIAEDDALRGRLTGVWAEIKSGAPLPLARLVEELEIPRLRARASAVPPSEDALAADRLLAEISCRQASICREATAERRTTRW